MPFPSPGDLPDPWSESGSRELQSDSLLCEPPGKLWLPRLSSKIPWNFLHDRNVFCSREVTLCGLLDGTQLQKKKDQAMIRSLECLFPLSIFQRGERGWKENSQLPCLPEVNIEIPTIWDLKSFHNGDHVKVLGDCRAQRDGKEGPHPLSFPSISHYAFLPSGCSSVFFIISFYNNLVNRK